MELKRLLIRSREPECEGLAFLLGHVERTEHPVPQRKAGAEVLVEVLWVGRMVHLVVRRTDEDAPEHAAERDPHVRVLQMYVRVNEENQDDVGVGERILIRGLAKHVVAEAV